MHLARPICRFRQTALATYPIRVEPTPVGAIPCSGINGILAGVTGARSVGAGFRIEKIRKCEARFHFPVRNFRIEAFASGEAARRA